MESLSKSIRLIPLVLVIGCCLVCGCASLQPKTGPSARTKPAGGPPHPADPRRVLEGLYRQVAEWKGTPYRLGGLSKEGIDCSGFVYMTYLNLFNIRLPRSTYQLSRMGDYVFQNDLSAGDLIFFRLGHATGHVGIYLENGLFAHASKSSGIRLSRLQDVYWSTRYWKAVRIKIDSP